MDNDENDFVNYNLTKKRKTKRRKDVLKYAKTCAIYGIFDCICCKKEENNRIYDETINQPSTSRLSNEDDTEQNSNDDLLDDIIDVGTDYVPSTSNKLSLEELEINKEEETCDRSSTNESIEINKPSEDVMEYINSVYQESSYENVDTIAGESEIDVLNEIDNTQLERSNNSSDENLDVSMEATFATTSDSLSTDETIANDLIKSEVLHVTEEEEEIDVVNIPADNIQNTLIENITEMMQQDTNQIEIKTELSDDENQIIDILNFDDTDRREDLVNNLENANMESTSNANEDEIIDVENLHEESPPPQNDLDSVALRLRRRQLKRRYRSQITINFRKRPRSLRSVMTIDLINSSQDDSIIEITDSPVVPRKVTEVINVDDDDDENEDPVLNTTFSPHRIGLGNCPVCLESLAKKEIMSTICGHVYCARCIKNVIKTTKKCPNCRKNLTLKSIHPLFI